MTNPWIEPLPLQEIGIISDLKDINVVFDVGARTSLDYLDLFPNAEYHLFEPYPPFFNYLKEETKNNPKIHVNGYALGEIEGELFYDFALQSFLKGSGESLPIKTLNWYIKQNNITRIDYLKIDAEAWDYKVLQGGTKAIGMARYIQYETWNERENTVIHDMLEDSYIIQDVGLRNMFCTRK